MVCDQELFRWIKPLDGNPQAVIMEIIIFISLKHNE